jgi:hypothetical protein
MVCVCVSSRYLLRGGVSDPPRPVSVQFDCHGTYCTVGIYPLKEGRHEDRRPVTEAVLQYYNIISWWIQSGRMVPCPYDSTMPMFHFAAHT